MSTLFIDIETRSKCDLKAAGVYNYSRDPSTSVLCIAYAFDDGEAQLWKPGNKMPLALIKHTGQIRAHNAAFERLMLRKFGMPYLDSQYYCTAAQARANCFPGSLEDVARFAGTDMRKDHRGALLIRKLCVPQEDGRFNADPALMAEMYEYCMQDVRTMREVSNAMRQLTRDELADYHVNERINDRGVRVDIGLAEAAVRYSAAELSEIKALVSDITCGEVKSTKSPRLRAWVHERVPVMMQEMMVGANGRPSIDKNVRANLLAFIEEYPDAVSPPVADVIQCADDAAAASTAKFARLLGLSDLADNRVRGAFVFAGGAATGRASSYGAQVHNFPRKCVKEAEACRATMEAGDALAPAFGNRITDVLKGMLRPALIPSPGCAFVVADWASIEARVTPWASGSASGESKLDVFRSGLDVYKDNATRMFGVPYDEVTDDQRQRSKITELSCGFGGGVGAFAAMSRAYGMSLPETEAQRMVKTWRRANLWAPVYWSELEQAYMRAMRHPGTQFSAGRVVYLFDGVHLWYCLPSGRVLCYPFARIEDGGVTYAKSAWKPKAGAKEWPRGRLWRGLACENVTQAIAADVLREALRKLEADGVVLHVHDEIVIECPTENASHVEAAMRLVMSTPPAWAPDLPLAAEIKTMSRYGKG